jgi:hypothetical protein
MSVTAKNAPKKSLEAELLSILLFIQVPGNESIPFQGVGANLFGYKLSKYYC